jgi:hypothetical protein
MQIIFEVFKWIFFLCSLFVALLYSIGKIVFNPEWYHLAILLLMPGYLLLAWLMVGYILANIQAAKYDKYPEYLHNVYKRWLVIGIIVGVLFAALYLGLYYTWTIVIA